jgi:hypothetical protein
MQRTASWKTDKYKIIISLISLLISSEGFAQKTGTMIRKMEGRKKGGCLVDL